MSQLDQTSFPTELVSEDLLSQLGKELDDGLSGAPSLPEDWMLAAKRWLNHNFTEIQKRICPRHDLIQRALDNPDTETMTAIGDAVLVAFTGITVTPLTLGTICTKAGLKHLCNGYTPTL